MVSLLHGSLKMIDLAFDMDINAFANARRGVAHQDTCSFKIYPVQDRLASEAMTKPVELHRKIEANLFPKPLDACSQGITIPGSALGVQEDVLGIGPISFDPCEQFQKNRVQDNDSRLLVAPRFQCFVLPNREAATLPIQKRPFERGHFAGAATAEPQENKNAPEDWTAISHQGLEFGLLHGAAIVALLVRNSLERIAFDYAVLSGPIKAGLNRGNDPLNGPIRSPCGMFVDPPKQNCGLGLGDRLSSDFTREVGKNTLPFLQGIRAGAFDPIVEVKLDDLFYGQRPARNWAFIVRLKQLQRSVCHFGAGLQSPRNGCRTPARATLLALGFILREEICGRKRNAGPVPGRVMKSSP